MSVTEYVSTFEQRQVIQSNLKIITWDDLEPIRRHVLSINKENIKKQLSENIKRLKKEGKDFSWLNNYY